MSTSRPRVLFYCHNVLGLGHIARSLRVARALGDRAEVAIVTGCRFVDLLDLPSDLNVERLPGLVSDGARFAPAPGEPADALERRPERIVEILRAVRPDVVVVDQRPLGLGGELMPALEYAAGERRAMRFIWGIPYLERADLVVPRPRNPSVVAALRTYDSAMVYDDTSLDIERAYGEYGLPDEVIHVGLVAPAPLESDEQPRRLVILSGGGTDGADLFELTAAALRNAGTASIPLRVVVGPFGDAENTVAMLEAAGCTDAEVWSTGTVEQATRDAAAVVARCGYNTAVTLVGSTLPVVFVPRHGHQDEQLRRAERFAALDGIWHVDESAEGAVAELAASIAAARRRGRAQRQVPFPLDGAERASAWVLERAGADR